MKEWDTKERKEGGNGTGPQRGREKAVKGSQGRMSTVCTTKGRGKHQRKLTGSENR